MGIKGLSAFLKKSCPDAWRGHTIEPSPEPQKVAVDVSLFLHKFFYSKIKLEYGFSKLRASLLEKNYIAVWVFDGSKLLLKAEEHERRKQVRESRTILVDAIVIDDVRSDHPGRNEYVAVKQFLSSDETHTAKYEAEALCSYLVKTGYVYAAVTDDTDAVAYACPRIFRGAACTLDKATEVRIEDILRDLNISQSVFQTFCVLCGGDFCSNEKQIGPVSALKKSKANIVLTDRYKQVYDLFTSFCYECNAAGELVETLVETQVETPSGSCEMESPNL